MAAIFSLECCRSIIQSKVIFACMYVFVCIWSCTICVSMSVYTHIYNLAHTAVHCFVLRFGMKHIIKLILFSKSINLFKFNYFTQMLIYFQSRPEVPTSMVVDSKGHRSRQAMLRRADFFTFQIQGPSSTRGHTLPSPHARTVGTQGFIESKTCTGRKGSPLTPSPRFRTQGRIPGHSPPLSSLPKKHLLTVSFS